jgi:hypothetical protein
VFPYFAAPHSIIRYQRINCSSTIPRARATCTEHIHSTLRTRVGSLWPYGPLRSPRCSLRSSWCPSRSPRCALRSRLCLLGLGLGSLVCPPVPLVSGVPLDPPACPPVPLAPGVSWVLPHVLQWRHGNSLVWPAAVTPPSLGVGVLVPAVRWLCRLSVAHAALATQQAQFSFSTCQSP